MTRITTLTVLLLLLCQACKTYEAKKLPENRIEFGSGGGFTGFTETWYLLKNGQVFFKHTTDSIAKEMSPVKRKMAKSLYKQVMKSPAMNMESKNPGNIYRFLNLYYKKTTSLHTWKPGDSEARLLDSLYIKLNTHINPAPKKQ